MVNDFGMIHIICGDGKGKTTAAVGLSIRAAGRGRKVVIARFLKSEDSGEIPILNQIHGIRVMPIEKFFGFTWKMDEQQKQEAAVYYNELFGKTIRMAVEEKADLLILDEILSVYNYKFVSQEAVLEFLNNKPEHLEVVLTGRDPKPELCDLADYISEVKKVKHPFEKGVPAREGIEY